MEILVLFKYSVLQLLATYVAVAVDSCSNGETVEYPEMHVSTSPNHLHFEPGSENAKVVMITRVGIEVRVDCWAPFPINIEFDGHLSNREIKVTLIKRSSAPMRWPAPGAVDQSSNSSISSFCFHINATLESFEEITGNYSCFNAINPSAKTSYYIFYIPSPPASLLNRGQHLIVTSKLDPRPAESAVITIPCPVSIPNVTVHLYNEKNQKINLTALGIEYDPKIGFRIPAASASTHFRSGNFQCRTELSDADKVDIQIVPERSSIAFPSQNIILLREGDRLRLSCLSTEEILMRIELTSAERQIFRNIGDGPKIMRNLTSPYRYNLTYMTNFTLRVGDTGRGSCWLKPTDMDTGAHEKETRLVHEWAFSVRERPSTNETNGIEGFSPLSCQIPGQTAIIKLFACNNWVECNLVRCKRNDRTCTSYECNDANTFSCLPAGIIQCFNVQNESTQELIFFTGVSRSGGGARGRAYTNWKHAPKRDLLKIQSIRELEPLERERPGPGSDSIPVEMICEGSAFLVAVGFKWFLRAQNEIEIPEDQIDHKWRSSTEKHIIRSIARASVGLTRNSTQATQIQIVCRAPVWNSTEWIEDVAPLKEWIKWNSSDTPSPSSSNSISAISGTNFGISRLLPFSVFIFLPTTRVC